MAERTSDPELAELATRQLRDTFALFTNLAGGRTAQYGNVFAYTTGLPAFMANGAIVTGPATADELRESLNWVVDQADLYLVTIDDRFAQPLIPALTERDMRLDDEPAPGMVLDPVAELPEPPDGIEIEPIDGSNYDAFASIVGAIFAPAEIVRAIFPLAMAIGPNIRVLLARSGDEYVGTAMAVRTGQLGGIYTVGTVEHARGKGVGRAVTSAAINAAVRDWGVRQIFLQSSRMGFSVYQKLGFRTVSGYQMLGGQRAAR